MDQLDKKKIHENSNTMNIDELQFIIPGHEEEKASPNRIDVCTLKRIYGFLFLTMKWLVNDICI